MNRKHASDAAGHSRAAKTNVEGLRCGAEVCFDRIKLLLRSALPRRLWKKVENLWRLALGLGQQEAAAAKRSEHRFGDASHELCCEDGIERVATIAQNFFGRCRGQRVATGDGAQDRHSNFPSVCGVFSCCPEILTPPF